ncbi:ABC transporter substrate-binding protein, partial [Georgenia sp. 10Sc9-8]|nr:ABC transporter substrate-binding protein [Georgenia halotolerans]
EGFAGLGGEVVHTEAVAPETRDFRSTVTTMSGQDVQALYLATFYSDAAVLAQQMASTGFDVPVLTNSSLFNPELVELGQEAVEGWYVATNFLPEDTAPEVTEFVSAYEAEYGTTPDQFAAIAYDTLAVLTTAMGQVVAEDGSIDKEELRDALYEIEHAGASGTIDFDEQGDVRKEMTYLQIVDGEFVPVEG